MSLVAYGASDDSDDSDEEVERHSGEKKNSGSIADVSGETYNNNNTTGADCPSLTVAARHEHQFPETTVDAISDEDEASEIHKALPLPKPPSAKPLIEVTEDDELEDMVKAKPSQIADLKPTKSAKKGRQPVKISIPALSNNSDDEDEPRSKKIKKSSKGSGLFSLLPAPRNVSLKETNRVLLPYTLKKPANTSKSTKPAAKSSSNKIAAKPLVQTKDAQSDSEDDDEPGSGSFFSLGHNPNSNSSLKNYQLDYKSVSLNPVVNENENGPLSVDYGPTTVLSGPVAGPTMNPNVQSDTRRRSDKTTDIIMNTVSETDTVMTQDVPLAFNRPTASADTPLSFKPGHSNPYSVSHDHFGQSSSSYSGYDTNTQENYNYPETHPQEDSSQIDTLLQDEEFLKLQGKKQRGREEVKIIDIDTNQFTSTDDLMKTLTVEKEHTSHRKKDNQPSGRQRNKHQITYLAYQAKERELTLKNQWAQNRQTKRQTQSKYGF